MTMRSVTISSAELSRSEIIRFVICSILTAHADGANSMHAQKRDRRKGRRSKCGNTPISIIIWSHWRWMMTSCQITHVQFRSFTFLFVHFALSCLSICLSHWRWRVMEGKKEIACRYRGACVRVRTFVYWLPSSRINTTEHLKWIFYWPAVTLPFVHFRFLTFLSLISLSQGK